MFETPRAIALRVYNATVRGVIMGADDSKLMQTIDVRGVNGELITGVERPQTYGFTSVPVAPDDNGGKAAEVVVSFKDGNRAHPVVQSEGDRRSRQKNLKPGESAHYDDQGQNNHIARDGFYSTHKQHVLTAGTTPDTSSQELNEQLKGLAARMSQMEHSHHGLFDVTSQFRSIVQSVIPAVAAVAPILNQDPTGLPLMAQAISGKEAAYLQQHIQDALQKFLTPNIGGVGSIMGGADTIISALESQISGLISANPIVATVQALEAELAALLSSATPVVIAQMQPTIQGLIDSTAAANPVIGQVANLQAQLTGLVTSAGDGLNFLAPQQRVVQGLSKALKLAQ